MRTSILTLSVLVLLTPAASPRAIQALQRVTPEGNLRLPGGLAPRVVPERGPVLFVDAQVAPGGDGTSWNSAFDDLNAAIAATAARPYVRELWVAAGTYVGGFDIPESLALYGGFLPGHTRKSQRRPAQHSTRLDGPNVMRVLVLNDASVVDGFTVQNGNTGGLGGGGALVDGTSPVIRNCAFTGNVNNGGRGSALLVRDNASPTVESTIFYGNGDSRSGHAVDINTSGGRFENIIVWNNVGNGFHLQLGSTPIIRNGVFGLNTGRGICHIDARDAPIVENNVFWNNSVALMHVMGSELTTIGAVNGLSYALDNVAGDPLWLDAPNGDFRPADASPCIDAGHAAPVLTAAADPRGNPRILDGDLDGLQRVDAGALEFNNVELGLTGALIPGGTVQLTATGTTALGVQIWLGRVPDVALHPPFGTRFFDVAESGLPITGGPLPYSGSVRLPLDLVSGDALIFQALVRNKTGTLGNWSNAVDVVVP